MVDTEHADVELAHPNNFDAVRRFQVSPEGKDPPALIVGVIVFVAVIRIMLMAVGQHVLLGTDVLRAVAVWALERAIALALPGAAALRSALMDMIRVLRLLARIMPGGVVANLDDGSERHLRSDDLVCAHSMDELALDSVDRGPHCAGRCSTPISECHRQAPSVYVVHGPIEVTPSDQGVHELPGGLLGHS
jgi:hypothetical protein